MGASASVVDIGAGDEEIIPLVFHTCRIVDKQN